jgi:hypothetical protein
MLAFTFPSAGRTMQEKPELRQWQHWRRRDNHVLGGRENAETEENLSVWYNSIMCIFCGSFHLETFLLPKFKSIVFCCSLPYLTD